MTIEALSGELERLQVEVRRLRRVSVVLGLLAVCPAIMGQAAPEKIPDEVKARRFSLIDGSGRTAASLEFLKGPRGTESSPRLKVMDFDNSLLAEVAPAGFAVKEFTGTILIRGSLFPNAGFEIASKNNKSGAAMTEVDGVAGILVKNSVGASIFESPRRE